MHIRKADLNDLDVLTHLMIEFKENLSKYRPPSLRVFNVKEKPLDKIKESVKKELNNPNGLFLVAEIEGIIVGFVYGTLGEYNHMVFEPVKRGNFNHIWVKGDYRGRGIATSLKDELFKWFKENNCEYIRLLVLDLNPALNIYKEWGFEDILDTMIKKL